MKAGHILILEASLHDLERDQVKREAYPTVYFVDSTLKSAEALTSKAAKGARRALGWLRRKKPGGVLGLIKTRFPRLCPSTGAGRRLPRRKVAVGSGRYEMRCRRPWRQRRFRSPL